MANAAPADPRCVAVADSVAANTTLAQLALAPGPRAMRPPRLGADVAPGASVAVTVLVRPDGTADTTQLEIRGSTDARYAAAVRRLLASTRFAPVRLAGCAVPGRYTFVTTRTRTAGGATDDRRAEVRGGDA
ncbi:hypothetical protein [Roseisolibacter sp. H3M3-2]|uniref:hypothetical protein n=1 Tax=Roseisolibacter sp. H3M3-2 TaxID=3031323 RepID=UPI0023DB20F6|nr:hypothetical protein [Roseisolibacter sp. H3M3-2]